MKERPIIMSGPMVRALLDGRKSVTRRVVKPQPEQRGALHGEPMWYWSSPRYENGDGVRYFHTGREAAERLMLTACPYGQPGDQLWVKETWTADFGDTFSDSHGAWWHEMPASLRTEKAVQWLYYRADDAVYHGPGRFPDCSSDERLSSWEPDDERGDRDGLRWRSPLFMPRWASRITLEITHVQVERLQEITDADCEAEGVRPSVDGKAGGRDWCDDETGWRRTYRQLWDELNAKRGFGWDTNPWVWRIAFRRSSGGGTT